MVKSLDVIDYGKMRVLSTSQLAEAFGTNSKVIAKNFQRNKGRYEEGQHYFVLMGKTLKNFKASYQNVESLKFVSILYLWTEKGAWLHTKSLNTKKAWEAYQNLFDMYYQVEKQ